MFFHFLFCGLFAVAVFAYNYYVLQKKFPWVNNAAGVLLAVATLFVAIHTYDDSLSERYNSTEISQQ